MILVNETREVPVREYDPNQCTRYCHDHGCVHSIQKYRYNSTFFVAKVMPDYYAFIHWLGHNGSGVSYKEMNLALFVGFFPGSIGLLLWGLIRKRS